MMDFLEKRTDGVSQAVRMVLGWHLAYLGVWALTSSWTFSWAGHFRCAHWFFGDLFNAIGNSAMMGILDHVFAWGLLVSGILLLLGRGVKAAAIFGIAYLVLMYMLNPPHFGHTGESHFLYVDRNVVEVCMLFWVMCQKKSSNEESEVAA